MIDETMNPENKTPDVAETTIVRRPYIGRVPCGKKINADASRWVTDVVWTEATQLGPVYGYLVLVTDENGYVNVLDLRHPEGEKPGDVSDDETWKRTREALARNKAKWWAYLPLAPPLNVDPKPWWFDSDGKPVVPEAEDPPRDKWKYATNLPNEIVR
jgi:hypothetical protein